MDNFYHLSSIIGILISRLVSLILLLILRLYHNLTIFTLFLSKQVLDCIRSINDFTTKFWPGSLTRNYLIHSFPAINSAVKIIFCISVVKKTDLGYVNKYIDATLIYMYMPSYLQNAVEHPSREFHCMGMFRESNEISGENSFSKLWPINISLESCKLTTLTLTNHWFKYRKDSNRVWALFKESTTFCWATSWALILQLLYMKSPHLAVFRSI